MRHQQIAIVIALVGFGCGSAETAARSERSVTEASAQTADVPEASEAREPAALAAAEEPAEVVAAAVVADEVVADAPMDAEPASDRGAPEGETTNAEALEDEELSTDDQLRRPAILRSGPRWRHERPRVSRSEGQ